VFESEKSEDHLFKVFYAGDLCRFPLKSGFDFGLEVKIIIRGKAVDRQNISVCDDESFFVEAVPDLSNNTLVPRVLVLIEPSVPL
jgi:hypothetical protein